MALTKIPGNLIETGAITAAALDNDAVTTAKILDANVTHAKLHATMDLTGKTVTVATAAGSTNTTAAASTAFVQQELTTLIGGAPGTLDTLNELAAAINDDDDYHTTLTTALATKLPLAGGSLTGALNTTGRVNLTDNNSISESYVQLGITNTVSSAGLFLHANSGTGKKYEIQSTADGKLIVYDRTSGAYRIQLLSTGELTVAGNIDTAGLLKVGGNDSEYANNYIRFKPTGAAYIDHNTVGQDINFRTSASSSLDRTPLVVQSGGILVTGSVNVSSNVIQAAGQQHVIGVWGTSGLQLIGQTGADNLVGSMGANEPLVFRTGSSERARIDASGNLMVGAGSTSTRAVITTDAVFQSYYSTETTSRIHLGRDVGIGGGAGVAFGGQGGYSLIGTDNTSGTNLYFNAGSNAVGNLTTGYQLMINGSSGVVIATGAGGNANKGILQFSTQANTYQLMGGNNIGYLGYKTGGYHRWFGTSGDVMRIDSSGNLLVGTTSAGTQAAGGVAIVPSTDSLIRIGHANGTGSGSKYMQFSYNQSELGSITQHGTSQVLFNVSSDQRLKENIADADDAGSKIDAIQVRKYDWKADGLHQDYGMIAQELQAVVPEAVSGSADSEEMMGVDYSKLVPMLIKEIQLLRQRVAQLEG